MFIRPSQIPIRSVVLRLYFMQIDLSPKLQMEKKCILKCNLALLSLSNPNFSKTISKLHFFVTQEMKLVLHKNYADEFHKSILMVTICVLFKYDNTIYKLLEEKTILFMINFK